MSTLQTALLLGCCDEEATAAHDLPVCSSQVGQSPDNRLFTQDLAVAVLGQSCLWLMALAQPHTPEPEMILLLKESLMDSEVV